MNQQRIALVLCPLGLAAALAAWAPPAAATRVQIFKAEGRETFSKGELDGVGLDRLGRLHLARKVEKVAAIEEPYLLSAAVLPGGGWVVGTGSAGRVFRVGVDGAVERILEAPEPEVFAVHADPDGTVYAATSPNGKVYRVAPGAAAGEPEVFFDPGETYVWALARAGDGRLLVATGTRGRLYAVDAKGRGTVLYDGHDVHLRSLAALPDGGVLVGTAGQGLVIRLAADATPHTLHDAEQPEIVALTPGPDGGYYAASLASEASRVDLTKSTSDSSESGEDSEEASGASAVVTGEGFSGAGTRAAAFSGARSEVLWIAAGGAVESLSSFESETVYSLLWQEGSLWVATGQEGQIFRWDGAGMVLEKDTEESQVVALLPGAGAPALATTNGAALYRASGGSEPRGVYTSDVLDTSQVGRFGRFRWWGEVPAGAGVEISLRTGISAEPDATWSAWSAASAASELDLSGLPRGRFLQWKAELTSGRGRSPRIDGVEVSYRQQNLRPRIKSVQVMEPGQILVPSNFNPSNQVYEPAHPNREGIFTSLEKSHSRGESRVKPLWKLGYRTVRWEVEDANDDVLAVRLEVRRDDEAGSRNGAGGGPGPGAFWLPIAEDLEDDHFSFDATVLPDGVYRFRLTASDEGANTPEEALSAEELTEPVLVDHSPPRLGETVRRGGELAVEVEDDLNPLREAVVSVDAGEWRPARAADGLVDGRSERLLVTVPEGSRLLLLKVTDAAHNVRTFDLSGKL